MAQNICIMLAMYTVRGVVGLANYWLAFEKFFVFPSLKQKKAKWIGIGVYFVINYLYEPMIHYGPLSLYYVILALYLVRIVPFLWAGYGFDWTYMALALFYGNWIECISQNIQIVFVENISGGLYYAFEADIFVMLTEILVFCVLIALVLLKRSNILRVYFTKLTTYEYILLFMVNMSFALMEVRIFELYKVTASVRVLSAITFILLISLIIHIIMVREQNTSMNDMIGNLKEPMKQITDSYIEMNEKNTELRRFRHDTKNLLFALSSLISDKKYEQASEYIEKMQEEIEANKGKAFDTGNFIADALLESKAKTAAQNDIIMTVEGNIPANRIEDVNLVILISNLVDNALEAARQVEGEKKIEIQSILKKNIWILSVKNSCVQDVVIRENRIETTKEEKESHGFGISNIERVAKKYGGNLKLSCENCVFTARATLMLMV